MKKKKSDSATPKEEEGGKNGGAQVGDKEQPVVSSGKTKDITNTVNAVNTANAAEASEPIIKIDNIVKIYNTGAVEVKALDGVSFEVRKGEMVAIMGPSGCGKTTLLNCASGLDDLTSGTVWIEGKDITKLDDKEKTLHRAKRMGFIFQFFNLQPVLTAIENVEFPLLVSGVDEKTAREMAMKALETVGLLEFKDHKPAELSGGQQQMVTIARSIVNEPAIIWADEPTGNLDTDSAKEIMKLLRKMNREKNQTYILVTHDPEVARYAERLIQMKNGRIERDKKQTPLC